MGVLVSTGKASMVELQTVLGVRDAYLLLEIILTDAHNRRIAQGDD